MSCTHSLFIIAPPLTALLIDPHSLTVWGTQRLFIDTLLAHPLANFLTHLDAPIPICGQSAVAIESPHLSQTRIKRSRNKPTKTSNTGETLSNTTFCSRDVTASYTQEETIKHRMLLCKSPRECIPTCTAKQHAPALMKESRARRSERQQRHDASLQPLQKGSFIRHQRHVFTNAQKCQLHKEVPVVWMLHCASSLPRTPLTITRHKPE